MIKNLQLIHNEPQVESSRTFLDLAKNTDRCVCMRVDELMCANGCVKTAACDLEKITIFFEFQLFYAKMTETLENGTHAAFLTQVKLPELEEVSSGIDSYEKLYAFSLNKPDLFWGTLARKRLQWFHDFHQVCNYDSFNCEDFHLKWFIGGKLNVSGGQLIFKYCFRNFFNLIASQ